MIEVGDYKIHASRREGPGMAEIHTRDTDIAYILQGSATLVTGGTAVGVKDTGPEELRGTAIEGGETRELKVGDVVVIPNGTPHWFKSVQGAVPLLRREGAPGRPRDRRRGPCEPRRARSARRGRRADSRRARRAPARARRRPRSTCRRCCRRP